MNPFKALFCYSAGLLFISTLSLNTGANASDQDRGSAVSVGREMLEGAAAGAALGCATPILISGGISLIGGPLAELYGGSVGLAICPQGALLLGTGGAIIGFIDASAHNAGELLRTLSESRFKPSNQEPDDRKDPSQTP